MDAFLSTIRSSVQGPMTVLIADTAHLEVHRLLDGVGALAKCYQEGDALVVRYANLWKNYEIIY